MTSTHAATEYDKQLPERIALKSVSINHANSEETWCFSATLYVDGRKAGIVRNHGHGGPDIHDWSDPQLGSVAERIGDEYWESIAGKSEHGGGLDVLVGELVNESLLVKQARQNAKSGYPVTIKVKSGPYEQLGMTRYRESHVVKLQSMDVLDQALAHYGADVYRIVRY
jgi:hypothetical protein